MAELRLTQISDTHLSHRVPNFNENFHRVAEYIDGTRPDIVVNTGDLAFDGPGHPDDLEFAQQLHAALPGEFHCIPGNHDIGDNPTLTGKHPERRPSKQSLDAFATAFGEDHFSFEAAGWRFIGINSLILNTGLTQEENQFDWLTTELSGFNGKPLALFIHKPLYKTAPDDPEIAATSFRYVPMPARKRLIDALSNVNLCLVASGHVHQRRDYTFGFVRHVWAPSTGFVIRSDEKQERIGAKEVGLVEYKFNPDGFEVRHVRAPGQVDIDLHTAIDVDKFAP
jgi:3',5'-cyclic AMP phosphodiesterase CpdA